MNSLRLHIHTAYDDDDDGGWRIGSVGKESDSRSKDQRFESRQREEHKNK